MNNIKRFISELKQQVDKELICIADPPIGIQDDPSAYGGKNHNRTQPMQGPAKTAHPASSVPSEK